MADITIADDKATWEARVDRLWSTRPARWRDAWYELSRNRLALGGSVIVAFFTLVAIVGPTRSRSSATHFCRHSARATCWGLMHWGGTS